MQECRQRTQFREQARVVLIIFEHSFCHGVTCHHDQFLFVGILVLVGKRFL